MVRGNLVAWKIVPASSETWHLQWLHWKQARRWERRQKLEPEQRGQAKPAGIVERLFALGFGAKVGEEAGEGEAFLELNLVFGHGRGLGGKREAVRIMIA